MYRGKDTCIVVRIHVSLPLYHDTCILMSLLYRARSDTLIGLPFELDACIEI